MKPVSRGSRAPARFLLQSGWTEVQCSAWLGPAVFYSKLVSERKRLRIPDLRHTSVYITGSNQNKNRTCCFELVNNVVPLVQSVVKCEYHSWKNRSDKGSSRDECVHDLFYLIISLYLSGAILLIRRGSVDVHLSIQLIFCVWSQIDNFPKTLTKDLYDRPYIGLRSAGCNSVCFAIIFLQKSWGHCNAIVLCNTVLLPAQDFSDKITWYHCKITLFQHCHWWNP